MKCHWLYSRFTNVFVVLRPSFIHCVGKSLHGDASRAAGGPWCSEMRVETTLAGRAPKRTAVPTTTTTNGALIVLLNPLWMFLVFALGRWDPVCPEPFKTSHLVLAPACPVFSVTPNEV